LALRSTKRVTASTIETRSSRIVRSRGFRSASSSLNASSRIKGGLSFQLILAKPEETLEAGDELRSLHREENGNGQSLPAGFRELPEGELLE